MDINLVVETGIKMDSFCVQASLCCILIAVSQNQLLIPLLLAVSATPWSPRLFLFLELSELVFAFIISQFFLAKK